VPDTTCYWDTVRPVPRSEQSWERYYETYRITRCPRHGRPIGECPPFAIDLGRIVVAPGCYWNTSEPCPRHGGSIMQCPEDDAHDA